jgi:hypothetical protein
MKTKCNCKQIFNRTTQARETNLRAPPQIKHSPMFEKTFTKVEQHKNGGATKEK